MIIIISFFYSPLISLVATPPPMAFHVGNFSLGLYTRTLWVLVLPLSLQKISQITDGKASARSLSGICFHASIHISYLCVVANVKQSFKKSRLKFPNAFLLPPKPPEATFVGSSSKPDVIG